MNTSTMPRPWLALGLPFIFVCLYGSGFVGAKLGLPYAGPFTFLGLRFGLAALLLVALALLVKAPWPERSADWMHIALAGFLGVGVFSAAAFSSIALGVPPAVSALIAALNPIVVALAAGPLLGEKTSKRQLLGLAVGFVGVYLVLRERLYVDPSYLPAIALSFVALLGLAAGNLYQKRRCTSMHLLSGGAIQCGVTAVVMFGGAAMFNEAPAVWSPEFIIALLWMAIVVSIGAVSILYVLIRRHDVSRVASVFYLMPASAAVGAYFLFGQTLSVSALIGMAVTATGVMLAARR